MLWNRWGRKLKWARKFKPFFHSTETIWIFYIRSGIHRVSCRSLSLKTTIGSRYSVAREVLFIFVWMPRAVLQLQHAVARDGQSPWELNNIAFGRISSHGAKALCSDSWEESKKNSGWSLRFACTKWCSTNLMLFSIIIVLGTLKKLR